MVQIHMLPESTQGRLGREMGTAFGQGMSKVGERIGQQEQSGILSKAFSGEASPEELAKLLPEYQMGMAKLQQQQQLQQEKLQEKQQLDLQKRQDQIRPLQAALDRVDRMRKIGEKGKLGRGSAIPGFFGGKTARDREEYEQLGKSLISLATTIPIRNRLEFEVLSEKLRDPSMTNQARAGMLDAMERIIRDSITKFMIPGEDTQEQQVPGQQPTQERPPLESFRKK